MAVRMSAATGNFTAAGTWKLVDSNLNSYVNSESATTVLTTTYVQSSSFSPGAITIDSIAVKLANRAGTTGTMSVSLFNITAGAMVIGTEVTINVSDLPVAATANADGGWIAFTFAAPITLIGGNFYTVQARTSSAAQVSLFSLATTNWSRALRTTTTGAPAAGDDLIIVGEYTGAGAGNNFTVTMNSTAATDYGAASTSFVTPALAVCKRGTLSYENSAATSYILRLSGNAIIYSAGVFNIGTVGSEIPRDSSAVLEFDCAVSGDFGLTIRNGGTWIAQGLSRTIGKNLDRCLLSANAAATNTSLTVDTDTGWLSGDEIIIASTSRTYTQFENRPLNANATAANLTFTTGLSFAHDGLSPVQAEVGLLRRNIRIRSTLSTAGSYVNFKGTAIINLDWVEFYYLGTNVSSKYGVTIETSTGTCNMDYVSIHDTVGSGGSSALIASSNANNFFCNNLVVANLSTNALGVQVLATSTSNYSFNNVLIIGGGGGSFGLYLLDHGGTFTNFSISSIGNFPVSFNGGNEAFGSCSNFNVHSNGNLDAVHFSQGLFNTSLSNFTLWRNATYGLATIGNLMNCTFSNFTIFGNGTSNINISSMVGNTTFSNFVVAGDASFSSPTGLTYAYPFVQLDFESSTFGVTSGAVLRPHTTADITAGTSINTNVKSIFRSCTLASTTQVTSTNFLFSDAALRFQRLGNTAGNHKTWKRAGTIFIDTTVTHTSLFAERLAPSLQNATLIGGSHMCAVNNGTSLNVSVWLNKGAGYSGTQPSLWIKKNIPLGILADAQLAQMSVGTGTWENLTATTAAVTDDGALEFYISCDRTGGSVGVTNYVNDTDWSFS